MLTLASLLFALSPLVPHAQPEAHGPKAEALTCAVLDIRSPQTPWRRDRFRATRIVELVFEARLHGRVTRERVLQLRLYTPRGFLYQVLELPIDASLTGERVFEARLPVAGTSIMASGLYGRWTVVPHIDQQPEPCGKGRSFAIRP